ncbi:MAG: hypothetical protein QXH19_02470 [Candidatus Bathyarchaeia archaeon]
MEVKSRMTYALTLLSILALASFAGITSLFPVSPVSAETTSLVSEGCPGEAERAEKILLLADAAKLRVEALLNSVFGNETVMDKIENASLLDELWSVNATFYDVGMTLLNDAHESFKGGDYVNATSYAMEALNVFRETFKEINRILCQADIIKCELIDGQGLLVAINRALARIERIREIIEAFSSVSDIISTLDEAEEYLNVTLAMELLQQGNVSDVARMLAEANRLIVEALRGLKVKIRERLSERIERFRENLERLRERVKERLREMNVPEYEFFKRWNFTNADEFWRKQIEILERVRERLREGINATELNVIGVRMREVCLELELRLREREGGGAKIEVNVEKIIEVSISRKITVTLRITVRNAGNVTLVFPNYAFGMIIERESNGRWRFYESPISIQVLRILEPGESGEVRIRLRAAEPGRYRVVVRALAREGFGAPEGYAEFTLP